MNLHASFDRLLLGLSLLSAATLCVATGSPGLLLAAGGLGAGSWYVTRGPRARHLPRGWLNLIAAGLTLWLAVRLRRPGHDGPVAMLGHFTLGLQLLLLYARRGVRENAVLLVISLLQMVIASLLSVSMAYAALLTLYCVTGVAASVRFHFVAVDARATALHARPCAGDAGPGTAAGPGPPPPRFTAEAGRGARRSLRRLGAAALGVTALVSLVTFVAIPRSSGTRFNATFAGASPASAPTRTGFSPEVRLGGGPLGEGSREPVLHLTVHDDRYNLGADGVNWLVRGMALDHYRADLFRWVASPLADTSRSPLVGPRPPVLPDPSGPPRASGPGLNANGPRARRAPPASFAAPGPPPAAPGPRFTARVTLRRGGPGLLFGVVPQPSAIGGPGFFPLRVETPGLRAVTYGRLDQQLRSVGAVPSGTRYRVDAPFAGTFFPGRRRRVTPPGPAEWPPGRTAVAASRVGRTGRGEPTGFGITRDTYARGWAPGGGRVRDHARAVLRQAGFDRDPAARHTPQDARIAATLSRHLSTRFVYTLENPAPGPGRDPVSAFLFDHRRGHCELFAAGLAALCQSVGIPARLVTGFRAAEYSKLGGYYVVRQSHAHAWTEIDAGPGLGWVSFDPTPAAPVAAAHAAPSGWRATAGRLWEYLEFAWIRRIIGFDERTRAAALAWVRGRTARAVAAGRAVIAGADPAAAAVGGGLFGVVLLGSISYGRGRGRGPNAESLRPGRRASHAATPPVGAINGRPALDAWYRHLRDGLIHAGVAPRPGQTPRDFAADAVGQHPARLADLPALIEDWYRLRYGVRPPAGPPPADLRRRGQELLTRLAPPVDNASRKPTGRARRRRTAVGGHTTLES